MIARQAPSTLLSNPSKKKKYGSLQRLWNVLAAATLLYLTRENWLSYFPADWSPRADVNIQAHALRPQFEWEDVRL